MTRFFRVLLFLAAACAACSGESPAPGSAGPDAAAPIPGDAGQPTDAAVGPADAGPILPADASGDWGRRDAASEALPDAGPAPDAGGHHHADAAVPADAGGQPSGDRDAASEAPPDAGSAPDAGSHHHADAAVPADAGGQAPDAGASGGALWQPPPGTSWQIQLSGSLDTSFDVQVYDIDLFDNSAQAIAGLKAQGRKVICYFSAGSYEDWRPDASSFPSSVLGNPLDGWPGEWWLDIRSQTVRDLMSARMDLAVQKGCDGVDPDNVDGYTNDTGLPLTAADQLDYNRFLASAGHARGLAVGLKNDVDQVPDLVGSFDWVIDEQCFQYNECDTLTPFISASKAVFEIEYGSSALAAQVCPQANALNFDTLIKDLDLDATRISCR